MYLSPVLSNIKGRYFLNRGTLLCSNSSKKYLNIFELVDKGSSVIFCRAFVLYNRKEKADSRKPGEITKHNSQCLT